MSIQDWGAVGEIVGGVAVIATLLYLATQLRQTNKAIRSSSFHEVQNSWLHINGWLVTNESVARIWRIGIVDAEQLTDDEFMQFSFFLLSTFHIMETIFIQYELGTVELRAWQGERRTIDNIFNSPGVQYWWKQNPWSFTTEFRDFLEQEIYRPDSLIDNQDSSV